MGKITDIQPQKKNKQRVNLYIDGEFFCGLYTFTALFKRLKIGDEVDEEALADAAFTDDCAAAFERTVKLLAVRPRAEKELRTYLLGKGYDGRVIGETLHKLKGYGYVDDEAFCRAYIESHRSKCGVKKMEAELLSKGVDREVIEEALGELDQADDAAARARKYLSSHAPDKRRLYAYLYARGFSAEDATSAIYRMEEEGYFTD